MRRACIAAVLTALLAVFGPAQAQTDFPGKPPRLIAPCPPGGTTDVFGHAPLVLVVHPAVKANTLAGLPGFEVSSIFGMAAPAGTLQPVPACLSAAPESVPGQGHRGRQHQGRMS